MSSDLTEAVSQVAATVVGEIDLVRGLDMYSSEVLDTSPSFVGKTANGLEVAVLKGCLGDPNRSSLLALGCKS